MSDNQLHHKIEFRLQRTKSKIHYQLSLSLKYPKYMIVFYLNFLHLIIPNKRNLFSIVSLISHLRWITTIKNKLITLIIKVLFVYNSNEKDNYRCTR